MTTVAVSLTTEPDQAAVTALGQQLGIPDAIRRFKVENGKLEVSFENHDLKADLNTGTGELVRYVKVPVLAQMTQLHQDTNDWWIYYSDVFGLSMLLIAITGMIMIPKGDKSFGGRGWKLAVAGMVFPLIFLFLLS
ncbi:MAG: PepSY-associated TM helix domain-containing protein [Bacteroidia bacterium]|nr:PepSY-associated TM helix domain-containing protein [Bacteroidia bacterium]